MQIEIDKKSGFCFGVVKAISKAEEELEKGGVLYCLGDIVHNGQEVERLSGMGLVTIDHDQFAELHDARVLLRAHGEPPSTYEIARKNNITLIDASCPVVLKLQSRIKQAWQGNDDEETQIVIYGKNGHAEVNGLVGQTNNKAIVVNYSEDLEKLDYTRKIKLFSQTTQSLDGFNSLIGSISGRMSSPENFEYSDTICRQVANRIPNITTFASEHDVVVFVSGKKSSNGKVLYEHSKKINPQTYFVSEPSDIDDLDLSPNAKVGICGATSTPMWQMEEVKKALELKFSSKD